MKRRYKRILAWLVVVFLLITTGFSTKVRRAEARNLIHLNSHIAKCWFHEGQVGKCTNITLATAFVMETKKCYDCYWYTQKAHYPNMYSYGEPSHTDYYGRAMFWRSNGLVSSLLKKFLDVGRGTSFLMMTWYDSVSLTY